jgi:hypothetical protein
MGWCILNGMGGRIIRVRHWQGNHEPTLFVVAEPDAAKALVILRRGLGDNSLDGEDVGPVSQQLIDALDLKPTWFCKA